MKLLSILVLVLAVVFFVLKPSPTRNGHFYLLNKTITTIDLKFEAFSVLPDFVKDQQPVLLKNSPASKWPALSKWTPQYVTKKSRGASFEVKENPNHKIFRYRSPDGILDPLPQDLKSKWPTVKKMTLTQFWDRVKTNSAVYFSTSLNHFHKSMLEDTPGIDTMRVDPDQEYSTFLWLGPKCATAQTHYDESHNFFTQIRGTKQFILSPPKSHWELNIHPYLYPGQRESQINFENNFNNGCDTPPTTDAASRVDHSAITVTLNPGDVLYIPPFWFHHVIALNDSISLNMWSDSHDANQMIKMSQLAIPFEADWSPHEMAVALQVYLCRITHLVLALNPGTTGPQQSASSFTQQLIQTQYQPLFGKLSSTPTHPLANCTSDKPTKAKMTALLQDHAYLPQLVQLFQEISDFAVREIILASYLEKVALAALGPNHVNYFVQFCLLC